MPLRRRLQHDKESDKKMFDADRWPDPNDLVRHLAVCRRGHTSYDGAARRLRVAPFALCRLGPLRFALVVDARNYDDDEKDGHCRLGRI